MVLDQLFHRGGPPEVRETRDHEGGDEPPSTRPHRQSKQRLTHGQRRSGFLYGLINLVNQGRKRVARVQQSPVPDTYVLTRSFSSEDDGQTGAREHQSAGKYGYSSKMHLQCRSERALQAQNERGVFQLR